MNSFKAIYLLSFFSDFVIIIVYMYTRGMKNMSKDYNDIQEFGNRNRSGRHRKDKYDIKKLSILGGVLLALIIVIVLIITKCTSDDNDESKTQTKKPVKQEETSLKSEKETSKDVESETQLFALGTESEIHSLVMSYIDAAYVKCDNTLLEAVMDSMENVSVEKNHVRQRYIESYNNINVYMLDGKENINVVFVQYDVKLYNYDTLLPSGETLKVKKGGDGKYRIHNIEVGEQFETHMINEGQVKALGELQEKIQSEYNAVIDSNSEIKGIVDILNGAKNQ